MITNDKEIIWMEKYRPQRIEDLVLPDHYINSFKEYIKNPRNILLTSETPGTGKTSISNAIIKEGQFECLFINASLDNGIDTLRGKIRQFASSIAFNDKCKLVVLDECLEENEEVLLVNNKTEYYSPLKDLVFGKKLKLFFLQYSIKANSLFFICSFCFSELGFISYKILFFLSIKSTK